MTFNFFKSNKEQNKEKDPVAKISFQPYLKSYNLQKTSFDFWINDQTAKEWYDFDASKSQEIIQLANIIKPEHEVLEFGLHYGFIATFLAKNCKKYLGVELSPTATIYSQAQFKINNLGENFQILNAAGSNEPGFINFNENDAQNLSVDFNETGSKIRCVTGDEIFPNCTFLKIDVEGFEVQVLEGCKEILKKNPTIAIEIHLDMLPRYGKTVEDIWSLISIDKYDGLYFHNPGSQYIDPSSHKILKSDRNAFPTQGIVNLFLKPKSNQD